MEWHGEGWVFRRVTGSAPSTGTPAATPNTGADAGASVPRSGDTAPETTPDPAPPADTQVDAPPGAIAGGTIADTPVAVIATTDSVGVTVGSTTVGDPAPAPPSDGVTVIADPGGGLPPITVKLP